MAKKLTDAKVRDAKAGMLWDTTTGLAFKVLPSGKKRWVQQLIWPGQTSQSKRTIGHYPAMSLADARREAERNYALAKEGTDPFEQEREEQRARAEKDARKFGAFAEKFIADRAANRRAEIDAREIRRNLIAEWGERPLHSIKPRDVRLLIDAIRKRAPYEARNVWTHVVQIFKLAVHEELIEVSPCASLDKRLLFASAKLRPRDRVLNDAELAALWRAAGQLGYPYGPFYKLLLLTGCRISEVAGAQWGEFAMGERIWTIPPDRFKSEAVHIVPLSDAAMSILDELPRWSDGDYLFTTTDGRKPINGFSKGKARLDALMKAELGDPLEPSFNNHDIRRTFRTRLSELRIADHIAELSIGHARVGLQGTYDRHSYIEERREAFERWSKRLEQIVDPDSAPQTPSNVVSLDRGVR